MKLFSCFYSVLRLREIDYFCGAKGLCQGADKAWLHQTVMNDN
jgi:site-specific DNA-cytosine methylase